MKFDIMTLFPAMVRAVLDESILGRAQKSGAIEVCCHNIRDYACNKHNNVDDTPFGGGMGMLMAAPPICRCYDAIVENAPKEEKRRVVYLSPKGRMFTQEVAKEFASYDRLILLCGHYEGIDQRVIEEIVDEEISVGDYVLTGGELPACLVVDAVSRLVDGVLADAVCYEEESIASGLLEYPQYTRPVSFRGKEVPPVLLSGHHENIRRWRLEKALELTKERRPELYEAYMAAHPPKEKKARRKKKPTEEA
ncbi:MAG: tRNA (guanosine(37)-N1)-methyltransferase TrmD [Clostridia bacterium]|nr:tRNA (guanosine(37)-N1)-methyltransferase TrmD [Clostridia bacterium]